LGKIAKNYQHNPGDSLRLSSTIATTLFFILLQKPLTLVIASNLTIIKNKLILLQKPLIS
jgi:hypothetical protein